MSKKRSTVIPPFGSPGCAGGSTEGGCAPSLGANTVAALFVAKGGTYWNLPGVEPWDDERDARLYDGPYPVVAHPPCKRWGRYWYGSPLSEKRYREGEDQGCFWAALDAVRAYGGVLEHPAGSAAWRAHGLFEPPSGGGWVLAESWGASAKGWTCQIDQAHFGHRARKATWLYAVGCDLPSLPWQQKRVPDPGGRLRRGVVALMSHKQRDATPEPFRDLLLSMARSTYRERPEGPPNAVQIRDQIDNERSALDHPLWEEKE